MIFVTGGAGYIGSHTCVERLQSGQEVVVFDNFSNSHPESLTRVEAITGKKVTCVEGDIRDQTAVATVLRQFDCQELIHFAGLKAVGESLEKPLEYYDNNVIGTHRLPLTEDHPLSAQSPRRTKLVIEDPQGVPNNLMPFVAQVAADRREQLKIWGNDYPTPDGTAYLTISMSSIWPSVTSRLWASE